MNHERLIAATEDQARDVVENALKAQEIDQYELKNTPDNEDWNIEVTFTPISTESEDRPNESHALHMKIAGAASELKVRGARIVEYTYDPDILRTRIHRS